MNFLAEEQETDILAAGPGGGSAVDDGTVPSGSDEQSGGNGGNTNGIATSTISDFLWKPVSESDGNLVVLVNPLAVRVEVTGSLSETLSDRGPSNGRGTTARGRHPGCSFGNGVTVEFFDRNDRRILLKDGRRSVSVPRGCDRYEFKL